MSTTILEPPIRVFKLTDRQAKISPRRASKTLPASARNDILTKFNAKMVLHDTIDRIARMLREPIAEIQEKRGISKNQSYTFIELIIALFQHSYAACIGMFMMVMNLLPLMEGLLTLCRFILDKIIDINDTESFPEKMLKGIIFIAELIVLFIILTMILSIILLPVFHLIEYCSHKVWGMVKN